MRKKILVAEDYRGDMAGIINIKEFDFKTMPKPQKYDMEPKDFEEWFNLFTSMMVAMDPVWDKILEQIMLDENGANVKKELKQKDIDERIDKATNKMLYLNLLEYTKGDAHAKVKALGTEGAFEAFRYVDAKGKNANVTHKMAMRTKSMNTEQAKHVKEVGSTELPNLVSRQRLGDCAENHILD